MIEHTLGYALEAGVVHLPHFKITTTGYDLCWLGPEHKENMVLPDLTGLRAPSWEDEQRNRAASHGHPSVMPSWASGAAVEDTNGIPAWSLITCTVCGRTEIVDVLGIDEVFGHRPAPTEATPEARASDPPRRYSFDRVHPTLMHVLEDRETPHAVCRAKLRKESDGEVHWYSHPVGVVQVCDDCLFGPDAK